MNNRQNAHATTVVEFSDFIEHCNYSILYEFLRNREAITELLKMNFK